MPFITQGKTNLKYILIVVVLAAIVGGGVLAYQYWWAVEEDGETIKSQCQIYSREGAADKAKREQLYPTREGDNKIALKFKEGSEVRLRNGALTSLCDEDFSQINDLIGNYPNITTQRLFSRSEEELTEEYRIVKQENPDVADLNLWYRLTLPESTSREMVDNLINKLNEFYVVEIAYPEPPPAPTPG